MKKKYKIGVFGSAAGATDEADKRADELGRELAKRDVIIITGATTGVVYTAPLAAWKQNKTEVWGFSAAFNLEEQNAISEGCDSIIYSKIIYIPKEIPVTDLAARRKYRNVTSTATCDAGIIVSGRWGTLNEFTNLFDFGKVIGVLTGTGGVADEILRLSQAISKPNSAVIVYDDSPVKLVDKVLSELQKRQ